MSLFKRDTDTQLSKNRKTVADKGWMRLLLTCPNCERQQFYVTPKGSYYCCYCEFETRIPKGAGDE